LTPRHPGAVCFAPFRRERSLRCLTTDALDRMGDRRSGTGISEQVVVRREKVMLRGNAAVRNCLLAAGLMLAGTVFAVPDARAADDMEQNERAVLEELNLARSNPSAYARYVEEHKNSFKRGYGVEVDGRRVRTVEGINAVDEAIAFLKQASPAPMLAASRSLTLSARDHVKDLGPRGMTGHVGTDQSQPTERVRRHGTPKTTSGECISFGPVSARAIVIQLIVDDGVPGRDHRKLLFDPDFRVAGIAIGPHKSYAYMCVIDFADQMSE